ncbi:hypothetical protein TrVE_jg7798 [Triparma verrucosa]|uniref:Uncharacterized protein n=1 Tax=Triparma verrucosa TaxID=1606542 RepID=A0A9W7ENS4_9STRA|nr:hypothetical protein TrVE_jg7798 [Triparma verrucosa]
MRVLSLLLLLVPSVLSFTFRSSSCSKTFPSVSPRLCGYGRSIPVVIQHKNVHKKAFKTELKAIQLEDAVRPAVVVGGTMGAYALRSTFNLPSPLSAPILLGSLSYLLINLNLPLQSHQPSLYCGAFAGTSAMSLMSTPLNSIYLGLIAAILFEAFERFKLFTGKGGRLGMCATMSSTVFTAVRGRLALGSELKAFIKSIPCSTNAAFAVATQATVVGAGGALVMPGLAASAGAVLCTLMRRRGFSPVTASSLVGSLGIWGIGGPLGALFYAGTFVGMSADAASVETRSLKGQVVAAGVMTVIFQVLGRGFLGGVGGKLGAAALGGVLVRDSLEK